MSETLTVDLTSEAKYVAKSLGIKEASIPTGKETQALQAMSQVATYPRLSEWDKKIVLPNIYSEFMSDHPEFAEQCRSAVAMIVASPLWVKGSLDNKTLLEEAVFWKYVAFAAGILSPVPTAATMRGHHPALQGDKGRLLKNTFSGDLTPRQKALLGGLGGTVLLAAVGAIASRSHGEFMEEIDRRLANGSLTLKEKREGYDDKKFLE